MNNVLTVHCKLLENGVRHEIVQLPQTITSADQLPAVLALPPRRCLAVRVYDVDGRHVAIIAAADTVPPAQVVREITGGRQARAAGEAEISSVTGYAAGLVAPLALPDEMPLYVDQALADSADDESGRLHRDRRARYRARHQAAGSAGRLCRKARRTRPAAIAFQPCHEPMPHRAAPDLRARRQAAADPGGQASRLPGRGGHGHARRRRRGRSRGPGTGTGTAGTGTAGTDSTGQASQSGRQLTVVIESVSPQWATPASKVTVTGIVRNGTATAQQDLSVQLRSSAFPLPNRSDLKLYAAGRSRRRTTRWGRSRRYCAASSPPAARSAGPPRCSRPRWA